MTAFEEFCATLARWTRRYNRLLISRINEKLSPAGLSISYAPRPRTDHVDV